LQLTGDLGEHLLELRGILTEELLQIPEQLTRGGNGGGNPTAVIIIPATRPFSSGRASQGRGTESRL
jgi:hypothetical protein